MTYSLKKMFGLTLTKEELKVLAAIKDSGLTSMRVVGRGTLLVDAKEVTSPLNLKNTLEKQKSWLIKLRKKP